MKDFFVIIASIFFLLFGAVNLYWYLDEGDIEDLIWGLIAFGFGIFGIVAL